MQGVDQGDCLGSGCALILSATYKQNILTRSLGRGEGRGRQQVTGGRQREPGDCGCAVLLPTVPCAAS